MLESFDVENFVNQVNAVVGAHFKLLRSQAIDSRESIPPAYEAWQAGTSNRVVPQPGRESILGLLKRFTNTGPVHIISLDPCLALSAVSETLERRCGRKGPNRTNLKQEKKLN
jgi:hypothetical protein